MIIAQEMTSSSSSPLNLHCVILLLLTGCLGGICTNQRKRGMLILTLILTISFLELRTQFS